MATRIGDEGAAAGVVAVPAKTGIATIEIGRVEIGRVGIAKDEVGKSEGEANESVPRKSAGVRLLPFGRRDLRIRIWKTMTKMKTMTIWNRCPATRMFRPGKRRFRTC